MNDVLEQENRRINLCNQGDAVNVKVLDALRKLLVRNDFYVRLSLNGSTLNDDGVAVVCAILKDINYIQHVDLENCSIKDRDVQYYIVPAVLAKNRLKTLNLCKNMNITDASVGALSTLIRESSLTCLQMSCTGLSRKSGDVLLSSLKQNVYLDVLDLPFSVGFQVLDKVKSYLEESKQKRRKLVEAHTEVVPPTKEADSSLSPTTPVANKPTAVEKHKPILLRSNRGGGTPSINANVFSTTMGGNVYDLCIKSSSEVCLMPLRTVGNAQSREWIDPAINRTLTSLSYMEKGGAGGQTITQQRNIIK
ncbi:hypothetical protein STCU_04740 [Strigomonas culicis]|uniref:Uncharacterized protein n=1 Tax=Strigomonas culicis TaxID=28005 RepID=S9VZE0_9TRYP|nr:hypothetical protein STCU_04740 [Strigomonas culicis]|eukprot:EPY29070.1 hypothetical protein STCU_04740 [Strigomonas culicis]